MPLLKSCYNLVIKRKLNFYKMKKIIPALILIFVCISSLNVFSQSFEDMITTLPKGTVLTLKQDFIIPPYEGIIEVDQKSENYKVYNLVFTSKDTRRILRKGTQFTVKEIEVGVGKVYIHIESKITWIYFGDIKNRDDLKISELQSLFDVEFPGVEEF